MSFAVTGIPSTIRAPGAWAEILLAQGVTSAPAGRREALYVGAMTSSGSATANQVYEIGDESQAIDLFGAGSPLHRAIRMHIKANPTGRVYGCPYAASSSGTPAAATATITATVTTLTAGGTAVFNVCGEEISLSWTTDSTATTIGEDLEGKINSLTHLPLTASNSTGTVTLTSKIAGASQNSIYRIRVKEYTTGVGLTLATSASTLGSGADGSTTEATNITSALTALTGSRYYYMGLTSPTQAHVALLKAHIATKSEPNPGLRSVGVVGAVGSLSATQTISTAQNHFRTRLVWQKNSEHDPAELVGNWLAVMQKREETNSRFNFDDYSEADWFIKPVFAASDRLDLDDIDDAVTDGITPINSNSGRSWIAMSVNTQSKDSAGNLDDFRAAETHRTSVLDEVMDTILINDRLTFKDFALMDDPLNADGTIDVNATIPPRTLTPSRYKSWLFSQLNQFFEQGKLQRKNEWVDGAAVRIDPQNNGRLQNRLSGRVIDLKHQVTFRISETTPN